MKNSIKKLLLTVLVTLFFISSNSKAVDPNDFPKEFMYQGKPIDPFCVNLQGALGQRNSVDLKQCSQHPTYKIEKVDRGLTDRGYVGYDYSVEDNKYNHPPGGSIYYKVLGKYKDDFVLYQNSNGGGSGFFTSIILVKRHGDTLQLVKKVVEGDRCNGGVKDNVEFKNNILKFEQHITPYDMLLLSEILPKTVKAYDDLAACAACCIGTALFEHDFEKKKLISVTLAKLEAGDSEVEQGKFQSCLNKLLCEYREKKMLTFTGRELKKLVEKFNGACLKAD